MYFVKTTNSVTPSSTDNDWEKICHRMAEVIIETTISIENFNRIFEAEEEKEEKHPKQQWGAGGKKLKKHSFWN